MSFDFKCPHCMQKLEGEENWVGIELPCPNCGKNIKVPSPQNNDSQNGVTPMENNNTGLTPLVKGNGTLTPLEDKSKNSGINAPSMQDDFLITAARQRLTKCFEHAQTMQVASNTANAVIENSGNSPLGLLLGGVLSLYGGKGKATEEDVSAFNSVRQKDILYLEQLDMLPYVGKKNTQLIATPHTFYAPAVMSNICAFAFAGSDREFIYSAEEITKMYIFKDQLIQVHALWDYTTETLLNEQSEAFFFRDITDISTEYGYDVIFTEKKLTFAERLKLFLENKALLIACIILLITIIGIPLAIIFFLLFTFEKQKHYVRKSETFRITSTSGRSMSMSLLCSEWIKAKKGKFEQRTSNEKIFHAIRKMVEEKKIEATNG